jgi:hypothetical protein
MTKTPPLLDIRAAAVGTDRATYDTEVIAMKKQCGAKTRKDTPCRAKALDNGRCRNHGGMSTGPKTPEGKAKSLANLIQYRKSAKR